VNAAMKEESRSRASIHALKKDAMDNDVRNSEVATGLENSMRLFYICLMELVSSI
jgi:hypothetical protein